MKSVEFTVQRLIETPSDSNARLQYRSASPADSKHDHVTADDVTADDERSTGARREECDTRPRHDGHVEPLVIHPSIYLDYARQFLWQLTAAYRPGSFTDLLDSIPFIHLSYFYLSCFELSGLFVDEF